MRIVTWNMNKRSAATRKRAWAYLRDELKADVALVQEAVPSPELPQVFQRIGEKPYNWGSAVVLLRPDLKLRARQGVPLADCYLSGVRGFDIPESHRGICAAADVLDARDRCLPTAISLYGAWEMMPNGGKDLIPGMQDDAAMKLNVLLAPESAPADTVAVSMAVKPA
jgi:hypothetical protein